MIPALHLNTDFLHYRISYPVAESIDHKEKKEEKYASTDSDAVVKPRTVRKTVEL